MTPQPSHTLVRCCVGGDSLILGQEVDTHASCVRSVCRLPNKVWFWSGPVEGLFAPAIMTGSDSLEVATKPCILCQTPRTNPTGEFVFITEPGGPLKTATMRFASSSMRGSKLDANKSAPTVIGLAPNNAAKKVEDATIGCIHTSIRDDSTEGLYLEKA